MVACFAFDIKGFFIFMGTCYGFSHGTTAYIFIDLIWKCCLHSWLRAVASDIKLQVIFTDKPCSFSCTPNICIRSCLLLYRYRTYTQIHTVTCCFFDVEILL